MSAPVVSRPLPWLPWRVLSGFGRSRWEACRHATVRDIEELAELFVRCSEEKTPLAFRGSGRSYGDPATQREGIVVDMRALSGCLSWNPSTGIADVEPGFTIEHLWRKALPDHHWPAVVPGTMLPTLGGCVAMNIHGKNNFQVGAIGDHVLDFDLLTVDGRRIHCSREENRGLFHAAIAGMGLLGAIVRVSLKLKRVESGMLRVRALTASCLDEMFTLFQDRIAQSDYFVGWIDCIARGNALGRGVIHEAHYIAAEEDPIGPVSFHMDRQDLPPTLFGIPRHLLPRLMRPFINTPGVRLINFAKYHMTRMTAGGRPFYQAHAAFAFLLDYVPNWELAYGPGGLVQFQVFAPVASAKQVFRDVLRTSLEHGFPSFLGVMKRHRSDEFLLSHALDGYSLALDYQVTESSRERLNQMFRRLVAIVLDGGGKFYFAKDSVLTSEEATRAYGEATLGRFFAIKRELDPHAILQSDLTRRLFTPYLSSASTR